MSMMYMVVQDVSGYIAATTVSTITVSRYTWGSKEASLFFLFFIFKN